MSRSNPSLALIGCGAWGANIARTLHRLGHLKAVVDPHPSAATRVHDLNVPFWSLDQALTDSSLQGIMIATPTPSHYEIAHKALSAGKHVFVEKPLASTDDQIQKLDVLATQKNRVLMVGHLLLYHPGFQKMVAEVDAGLIGDIIKIESYRRNFGKFFDYESVGWDLGVHDMSMVLALMKEAPSTARSSSAKTLTSHGDIETITMTFPKGAVAELHLSRLAPQKEQKLIVYGTKGLMIFDDVQPWEGKLVRYMYTHDPRTSSWALSLPHPYTFFPSSPLDHEMVHFMECISKGATPLSPASQGLMIHQILEKALSS